VNNKLFLDNIYFKGKKALVRARLVKRLRALKMASIRQYIKYLESGKDENEMGFLVDVMTTNKTSFFREAEHFNYLRDQVLPGLQSHRLRFWSAACSSGEEPYTLAIWLREHMSDLDSKDVLILATDISRQMLEKARLAVYPAETLQNLPSAQFNKYFTKLNIRISKFVWEVNHYRIVPFMIQCYGYCICFIF